MKKRIILIVVIIILIVIVLSNKLYVKNYNFSLNGSDTIILNIDDTWTDPLYTVYNNKEIKVQDNINYNKIGEYYVTYTLKIGLFKKTLERKVIIVGEGEKTNFTLTLKGDNPYYLMENHPWQEPGYEAYDLKDGDLTNKVEIYGTVNNTGTSEIKYQVNNSDGITKTITRKIIVYNLNFEGKLKNTNYTQNNEIILDINDSNYQHTLLPNNKTTINNAINFPVEENGEYKFIIYDKNNNSFEYIMNVSNIDREKPTGTCILSLLNKGAKISVNANDNSGIDGYEYQYNKNKTSILKESEYTISTMDEIASVTIYDLAGNYNTISCNVVDNSTKHTREYTLESYNFNGTIKKYWFYKPKRTEREKYPLVIYFHGAGGSSSVNAVNNIVIPKNIKDGHDFPYYVIAPYNGTQENFVLSLIKYITGNFNIDTKRIVLSGGSAGSPAALGIGGRNPNIFSCLVIISSYTNTINVNVNNLTNIPIWFFQGTGDMYKNVESFVNKINEAGGNAKLTSYSGGHDSPADAFLRSDLTNWILNNKTK